MYHNPTQARAPEPTGIRRAWPQVPTPFPVSERGCPGSPAELRGEPRWCLQQPPRGWRDPQRRDPLHPPARYNRLTENRSESAKKRTAPASFRVPRPFSPCPARARWNPRRRWDPPQGREGHLTPGLPPGPPRSPASSPVSAGPLEGGTATHNAGRIPAFVWGVRKIADDWAPKTLWAEHPCRGARWRVPEGDWGLVSKLPLPSNVFKSR